MCIPYHNTETCSRPDHNKLNWIFKTQTCSRNQWNTFNKSRDIVPFLKQLNGLHLLPLLWKITMKGNPIMLNILTKIKQSKLKLESQSFSFFLYFKSWVSTEWTIGIEINRSMHLRTLFLRFPNAKHSLFNYHQHFHVVKAIFIWV